MFLFKFYKYHVHQFRKIIQIKTYGQIGWNQGFWTKASSVLHIQYIQVLYDAFTLFNYIFSVDIIDILCWSYTSFLFLIMVILDFDLFLILSMLLMKEKLVNYELLLFSEWINIHFTDVWLNVSRFHP